MPRKPRVEFAGAVYHVMCRGDRREPIVLNDEDRRVFLETLVEARERTGWLLHAYVLMANLVQSRAASLSVYPWSSYPEYLKPPRRRPEWITVPRVLGDLGLADDRSGRRGYASHLKRLRAEWQEQAGREQMESEWNEIRRGWFLGSETFGETVRDLAGGVMKGKQRDSYTGAARAAHDEQAARDLLDTGLELLDLTEDDLGALAKSDPRKQVLAWWVRRQTAVSNAWISDQLKMGHPGNLSTMVKNVERKPTVAMVRMKKRIRAHRPAQTY